jgi:hypothetical protein
MDCETVDLNVTKSYKLQRNYYENTVEATIRLSDVISARGG